LITHQTYSEPPEKDLKKPPPTPSEIASFWTPLPSEFPLPSVEGDMDIFWNFTFKNSQWGGRGAI